MSKDLEAIERVTCEILTGQMQDRYVESGVLQLHPNYIRDPELAIYGTPNQTRLAIGTAFILRWAGSNGRPEHQIPADSPVPMLFDIRGDVVHYDQLEPPRAFSLLRAIGFIESMPEVITPVAKIRKILGQNPSQTFTVLPPKKGLRALLGPGLLDAVRAHDLYTERIYGPSAYIPLGQTTGTPSNDRRRRKLK